MMVTRAEFKKKMDENVALIMRDWQERAYDEGYAEGYAECARRVQAAIGEAGKFEPVADMDEMKRVQPQVQSAECRGESAQPILNGLDDASDEEVELEHDDDDDDDECDGCDCAKCVGGGVTEAAKDVLREDGILLD